MAQAAREIVGDRIIPAYAGSTTCRAANRCRLIGSSPHTRGALPSSRIPDGAREDHPRIRGEHLSDLPGEHDGPGIIPAYAGSTPRPSRAGAPFSGSSPHTRGAPARASSTGHATRDHPRIRGEHSRAVFDDRPAVGIIPAYAGSTKYALSRSRPSAGSSPHTRGAPPTSRRRTRPRRDHPRIRGEHPGNPLAEVVGAGIIPAYAGSTHTSMYGSEGNSGSSPHTRGAREAPSWQTTDTRIIPAYAGSTAQGGDNDVGVMGSSPHTRGAPLTPLRPWARTQDHPRIRGEHRVAAVTVLPVEGIIPAYAGSTWDRDTAWHASDGSSPHTRGALHLRFLLPPLTEDHPRIRGEHVVDATGCGPVRGIIPAYAGSTSTSCLYASTTPGSSPHTRGAL